MSGCGNTANTTRHKRAYEGTREHHISKKPHGSQRKATEGNLRAKQGKGKARMPHNGITGQWKAGPEKGSTVRQRRACKGKGG